MADKEAREISLRATVQELDKATQELGKIRERAIGKEKEELELKIKSLQKVREELIVICHKTFPLWVPPQA